MKRWPWGLLSGACAALAGCDQPTEAVNPPVQPAAVPPKTASMETATFAVG